MGAKSTMPRRTRPKRSARSWFLESRPTLESVLSIAIFVILFRGFISQGFVIPTGSMAPTLYGQHVDHVCSHCGYAFAVGLDDRAPPPTRAVCPNCDGIDAIQVTRADVNAGDGVFVLNGVFGTGPALALDRWDVAVFKAPFGGLTSTSEPEGQTNYIKRIAGLPEEVLQLVDGDLFVAPAGSVPADIREKLLRAPRSLDADELARLDSLLQIVRKPSDVQEALWMPVYDADYPSSRPGAPAWTPIRPEDTAWHLEPHQIRFAGGSGTQADFIQLTNKTFGDDYGYNGGAARHIVSDLHIRCVATWRGGGGAIVLGLSKRDALYLAELVPATGQGRLTRRSLQGAEPEQPLASWQGPPWRTGHPVTLDFVNADHRRQVWMNGRLLWQDDESFTAAQAKALGPQVAPPVVLVGAAGLQLDLGRLVVERDVYYRDNSAGEQVLEPIDASGRPIRIKGPDGVVRAHPMAGQPGWATQGNPILLRSDEYFALGDNSPRSLDSRLWWQTGRHLLGRTPEYRLGTVPADQIVGKAFVVYWPSWGRPLGLGPRIIPNFGELRWIH